MNRRLLAPLALVAALSLTACAGGPTATPSPDSVPGSVLPDAGKSGSGAPQVKGGSATVTFDDVTYEFSSEMGSSCRVVGGIVLNIRLELESINGESADPDNGLLDIELPTGAAAESLREEASVLLRINDSGLQFYEAGGSEVTLTVGEHTAHGEQVLENRGDRPPITAQIDVACNVSK